MLPQLVQALFPLQDGFFDQQRPFFIGSEDSAHLDQVSPEGPQLRSGVFSCGVRVSVFQVKGHFRDIKIKVRPASPAISGYVQRLIFLLFKKIAVNFMQQTGPGVFMPAYVEYSWSKNGKDYSAPVRIQNTLPDNDPKLVIKPFEVAVNAQARYIRIMARNDKHGFLFADEILVY